MSELISLKVDLVVTSAPAATQAAKEATTTTPIVMVLVADPVAFGFVNSLARPGSNITGFAFLLPEISGKRLELLKETIQSCLVLECFGTPPNVLARADKVIR